MTKQSTWLPLLSGIVTIFSFPTTIGNTLLPRMGWLAWFSLVPLFLALREATPSQAFRRVFLAMGVMYLGSIWWMVLAMTTYGHLGYFPSYAALLALCIIFCLSHGAAAALAAWIGRRLNISILAILPLTWIIFEWQRGHWPSGGCPWSSLGYSQSQHLLFLQGADLFGIYGLTGAIVAVNGALIAGWIRLFRFSRLKRGEPWGLPTAGIFIFVGLIGYGHFRYEQVSRDVAAAPQAKVALLQGNIPQDVKYDTAFAQSILNNFKEMTRMADGQGVDLIVWPEAAYPYNMPVTSRQLPLGLAEVNAPIVAGVVGEGVENRERFFTNSAWLLAGKSQEVLGRYDKAHLVPLGEYVPFGKLLWFARKLVPEIGDFRRGQAEPPLVASGLRLGMTICFEDLFPEISSGFARQGIDLFVNMTNDAWYGQSPAVYQHFDFSRMRSVEHRRSTVRATNTGLSGFIDPVGRDSHKPPMWEPHVIIGSAPIYRGFSLYTRIGDLLVYLATAIVAALALLASRYSIR